MEPETAVRALASWVVTGSFTAAGGAEEVRRGPIGNTTMSVEVALARTTNPSVDGEVPVPRTTFGTSTTFGNTRFVLVKMQKMRPVNVLVDDGLWAIKTELSNIGHTGTADIRPKRGVYPTKKTTPHDSEYNYIERGSACYRVPI